MLKETNIKVPTPEEIESNNKRWIATHMPNCLSAWFPKLAETGVLVPKTEIVILDEDLSLWAYGEPVERLNEYLGQIGDACDKIGYPCFLRSGQTSDKHHWKETCYLESREDLQKHVYNIVEFSACVDIPANVFVARELLKTEPAFYAFHDMPITKEFRFFVQDDVITHIQPYWPPHAIEGHTNDPDWQNKLADISTLPTKEIYDLMELSARIGKHIGGYWSVDWLWVPDKGWYCTDMALGQASFKWDPKDAKSENI